MMLTVITASAQELSAHITADEQTGSITVSGNGAAYGGQLVSILIAEDEGGFYSPDSPLITEAVHSDENGGFTLTVFPAKALSGGEYQAEIATSDSRLSLSFIAVSLDSAGELFELAAKCGEKSALAELLQTRPYDMGISEEQWAAHSSALTDAVYAGIDECKSTSDFLKLCRSALAMERIKNGEDVAGILQESVNSMYVGDVTCLEMWNALDNDSRKNVMTFYTPNTDAALGFAQACAMSAVKSSSDWHELAGVLSPLEKNVFTDVLRLNTSRVTEDNSNQIVRLVYKELNSISTPEDLRREFLEASKNYGGGSSGGASGGMSGGSKGSSSPTMNNSAFGGAVSFDQKAPASLISFSDTTGHWGEGYISKLAQSGGIKGYSDGSFRPDNPVTRAEFATMLAQCFKLDNSGALADFADVAASDWFAGGVWACSSHNIVYGDENKLFNPALNITREDAATMLYRFLGSKVQFDEVSQIPFNDESQISDYARAAVGVMVDEGVLSGFGNGYFKPHENTTRAQAAAMIVKSLDLLRAVS